MGAMLSITTGCFPPNLRSACRDREGAVGLTDPLVASTVRSTSGIVWTVKDLWSALAAVAATVQAVVVVLAALYALAQVRESRRSSALASLISLNSLIDSDEAVEDRRRLFNELPADLTGNLSVDEQAIAYRVTRMFNFIGDLIDQGIVDFDLIANSHARPISRIWQRLEPWVLQERRREKQAALAFEHLGRRCRSWDQLRHGADVAVPYRHDQDPSSE